MVVDTTKFFKENNTNFKIVSRKIYFDTSGDYIFDLYKKNYNTKYKKTLKTKFLSCYRSSNVDTNNKYFIEFYSIE